LYKQISQSWQKNLSKNLGEIKKRAIIWRKESTIVRLNRPTRLDRARSFGYKAKMGFVTVRIKVGRGGMRKKRPDAGRRPKHLGTTKIKAAVSMQQVAERRALKKFPNMSLLGSYFLYQDGKTSWFEIMLCDRNHPSTQNDPNFGRSLHNN